MTPPKCSVYIATSLDGFIARKDGSVGWLNVPPEISMKSDEDYGYKKFFGSVDVLVMGRNSYELVLTFGGWPYEDKKVVVLSSGHPRISENLASQVEIMSGRPGEIVQRLAERGAHHLYIDGGKTVQDFLEAGLIDEMTITRIPVLLGAGIPLFGPLSRDVRLRHIETNAYPNGLVQSKYQVAGTGQ